MDSGGISVVFCVNGWDGGRRGYSCRLAGRVLTVSLRK